ncbi:hypothetical protein [Cloacibacillus evryensis]|uniref:hypothetical protein n=1 Tax=Cloacibacillus evryensis TaxID=508460 RepID=UPI0024201806|nr:hypothetical protein [Cloacibacillus evryensis]
MSQQELQSAWESFCQVVCVIFPLALVSGLVSFCNFFQRHWGTEPFRLSKLLIGVGTDIVYGTLVGLATIGMGRNSFLAWSVAGFAVHCGIRQIERAVKRALYTKFKIEGEGHVGKDE